MYTIKLFNSFINVKSEHCINNKSKEIIKIDKPYVNIYVKLRNDCNAKCKFCEFTNNEIFFNMDKFRTVLQYINNELKINKVSFTGGEPTLDKCHLLFECSKFVKSLDRNIFTVVNTNGANFYLLKNIIYLDSIALSRHHYDDKINNEILGFNAPSLEQIKDFANKNILHLSCNLIKGYIDNETEVIKYLETAAQVGVLDVGFVSLMKVNNFCNEHHIDFSTLNFDNYKNIYINKDWSHGDTCKCRNYLYISDSTCDIVKAYSRYYQKTDGPIESQLVFDGKNLKDGFNGKIIH